MLRKDFPTLLRVSRGLASAALVAFSIATMAPAPAMAQSLGCKLSDKPGKPPVDVLTCDGLLIESEKNTEVRVLDRAGRATPDAAEVEGGAVLVSVRPGRSAPFQILTPRAIASVRGTRYAIDAGPDRTSVFVETGTVAISRPYGGPELLLGRGEGVDVSDDATPLRKTTWKRRRVVALLKRLRH